MLRSSNSRRWRVFASLWAAVALAGCAAPARVASAVSPPARLAIVNLTPHAWRIRVIGMAGGEVRVTPIGPRATTEIELAGGDYRIEQAVLNGAGGVESMREFPTRLIAGETYRWPLATLLTEADDEPPAATGGAAR